ncbi:twin-arginine translocase subunit TatC [Nitrososphaera viennensis]|uniref:Sec-independent protein translocase protein TatC n=2 Tax=Nitrososphaera viennensis TaxID=1034015 RepID=A0A060HQH9_9ARCH|nr:twin-arginine translocase subunit TatC [Nitrososphaera viennensis]AIC15801.1 TatC subunit of twin-arginine targeting system [Nitrososphaera viennensis EN76]UVS67797.1 twin-arginine translocase subunit TatC [Nitrososphaera viennensis]
MASEMTFFEHIDELRTRIVRMAIAVIAITIFCMAFSLHPFEYAGIPLAYPFPDPINNVSAQIMLFMQKDLIPPTVTLVQIAPGQAFFAQVYVSMLAGIIGAMPVIVKEIAGFIAPAISPKARKSISHVVAPAIALFVAGVAFSYLVAVPFVLQFLYQYGEAIGAVALFNVSDFISFVLQFLLGFGIAFELPVMMYGISLTGAMSPYFWRNNIRYAVIVLVVFGAIITPDGSGITMWFVAGPMIVLYLAGMAAVESRAKKLERVAGARA